MNDSQIQTVTQPCPVCGAEPQNRTWSKLVYENYTKVRTPKHKMVGSSLTPLVCTQCGYVQLFVDPNDFRVEPQ